MKSLKEACTSWYLTRTLQRLRNNMAQEEGRDALSMMFEALQTGQPVEGGISFPEGVYERFKAALASRLCEQGADVPEMVKMGEISTSDFKFYSKHRRKILTRLIKDAGTAAGVPVHNATGDFATRIEQTKVCFKKRVGPDLTESCIDFSKVQDMMTPYCDVGDRLVYVFANDVTWMMLNAFTSGSSFGKNYCASADLGLVAFYQDNNMVFGSSNSYDTVKRNLEKWVGDCKGEANRCPVCFEDNQCLNICDKCLQAQCIDCDIKLNWECSLCKAEKPECTRNKVSKGLLNLLEQK